MLDLSWSSCWKSQASGRSSAMSMKSSDSIFFRNVSGRGHKDKWAMLVTAVAAGRATDAESRGGAGAAGSVVLGMIVGGWRAGIRGTPPRAVAGGVVPIITRGDVAAIVVARVVAAWEQQYETGQYGWLGSKAGWAMAELAT